MVLAQECAGAVAFAFEFMVPKQKVRSMDMRHSPCDADMKACNCSGVRGGISLEYFRNTLYELKPRKTREWKFSDAFCSRAHSRTGKTAPQADDDEPDKKRTPKSLSGFSGCAQAGGCRRVIERNVPGVC